MRNKYMVEVTDEKVAKARVNDVDASYKDLTAVCDNVRGMGTEEAIKFLEEVAEGKRAVLYRRHNKKMAHRRELGGKKGRYPKKEARIVLDVLKNALANAEHKGMFDTFVFHIAANKQHIYPRISSKGRPMMSNYETAFVEVILKERTVSKRPEQSKEKQTGETGAKREQVSEKGKSTEKTESAGKAGKGKPSEKTESKQKKRSSDVSEKK